MLFFDFLYCSHLRYKPVIEMLENKLQIRRDVIDSQKKLIKSIIKVWLAWVVCFLGRDVPRDVDSLIS